MHCAPRFPQPQRVGYNTCPERGAHPPRANPPKCEGLPRCPETGPLTGRPETRSSDRATRGPRVASRRWTSTRSTTTTTARASSTQNASTTRAELAEEREDHKGRDPRHGRRADVATSTTTTRRAASSARPRRRSRRSPCPRRGRVPPGHDGAAEDPAELNNRPTVLQTVAIYRCRW
jgi:hypothetical protein